MPAALSCSPALCFAPLAPQWYGTVPLDLEEHLRHTLMQQDRAAGGLLQPNLSLQLAAALEEAHLFERQRMGVPRAVADLLPLRPQLRALWVGAVQVCRAYDAVLGGLSPEGRRLCRDRIRWEVGGEERCLRWCGKRWCASLLCSMP